MRMPFRSIKNIKTYSVLFGKRCCAFWLPPAVLKNNHLHVSFDTYELTWLGLVVFPVQIQDFQRESLVCSASNLQPALPLWSVDLTCSDLHVAPATEHPLSAAAAEQGGGLCEGGKPLSAQIHTVTVAAMLLKLI